MSEFLSRRRPSPAMAVAFVALLAALSGTAIALPGKNTVDSGDIKKGAVKRSDIARNAVTGAKIKTGAVGSSDTRNNSLTGADINESSLGQVPSASTADNANAIANNSVNSAKVADDSLTGADLATDSVDASELSALQVRSSAPTAVAGGTDANGFFLSATATATCDAGEDLMSWSVRWTTVDGTEEVSIMNVTPDFATASVTVLAGTDEAAEETFVVDAWCL